MKSQVAMSTLYLRRQSVLSITISARGLQFVLVMRYVHLVIIGVTEVVSEPAYIIE
jgi:hypothetical protein